MKTIKILASEIAKLDSNVWDGGGADDTSALQEVLDMADNDTGVHLVMDGAALISGLRLGSNTTIECMNSDCGFYLKDNANAPLIQLRNPSYTQRLTRNITLQGGTYNHNNANQEHNVPVEEGGLRFGIEGISDDFGNRRLVVAFETIGIENMVVRDITIRNQRAWSWMCANFKNVTMENVFIDLPNWMKSQNQDGLHFWGPGQFLTLRNIKGRSGDDFIALAPDEHDEVSDITDVLIDGVHIDNADQCIRMLCRAEGRLDRVTVKNVSGSYRSYGFFINPWFPNTFGNYGHILFENIDLRPLDHVYPYRTAVLFDIGGNFDCITFKNIHHQDQSDNRPLFLFGLPFHNNNLDYPKDARPRIRNVVIDGLFILEKETDPHVESYIHVYDKVENLFLKNVIVSRSGKNEAAGQLECFIQFKAHESYDKLGVIDNLVLHDIYMPKDRKLLSDEACVHRLRSTCYNTD